MHKRPYSHLLLASLTALSFTSHPVVAKDAIPYGYKPQSVGDFDRHLPPKSDHQTVTVVDEPRSKEVPPPPAASPNAKVRATKKRGASISRRHQKLPQHRHASP